MVVECKGCRREIGGSATRRGKLPADGLCSDCRRRAALRKGAALPQHRPPARQTGPNAVKYGDG